MYSIDTIFHKLQKILQEDKISNAFSKLEDSQFVSHEFVDEYLKNVFDLIKEVIKEIEKDECLLVSIKDQKLLKTHFQFIVALGIIPCLLPGLGINLSRRCSSFRLPPKINWDDQKKYATLTGCIDFFIHCCKTSILKNIIMTFHLSDYLAALLQLSFAPLKKPGNYENFIMTNDLYEKVNSNKLKYKKVFRDLVANSYQPALMRELLTLQSETNPQPPAFVKRILSKEMSARLTASEGLLSLIRCLIESPNIDTGYEWKKIDLICKLVSTKHGNYSESDYLEIICSQIRQIISLNNTHYLVIVVSCIWKLREKYSDYVCINSLLEESLYSLNYENVIKKCTLPGTVAISPIEMVNKINIIHAFICLCKQDWDLNLFLSNLYLLCLYVMKYEKGDDFKIKIQDIILCYLEKANMQELHTILNIILFGQKQTDLSNDSLNIVVYKSECGPGFKVVRSELVFDRNEALLYFLELLKSIESNNIIAKIFNALLEMFTSVSNKKLEYSNDKLFELDNASQVVALNDSQLQYICILQLLTEMCSLPKVITSLKTDQSAILNFIEQCLLKNYDSSSADCINISLILLNIILSDKTTVRSNKTYNLVPILKKISSENNSHSLLCEEALSLLTEKRSNSTSICEEAIDNLFDSLLPVRAHGITQLTKLINQKDTEALCKKQYIFCLFQQHLNDSDSYIYLAAINGIASLAIHCPEDTLNTLCREYLEISRKPDELDTEESSNKNIELRMKIGDVMVKVIKGLGDIAVVHKSLFLNTVLCACRDHHPLMRASAISNLAEIALVLNYKIGSIIYEVLTCILNTIQSDNSIECRRAAVMVLASLLKGIGNETLIQLKEELLPIYRTLKKLYNDAIEDSVVRLHAQIALEELDDIVRDFLFPQIQLEKQIYVTSKPPN